MARLTRILFVNWRACWPILAAALLAMAAPGAKAAARAADDGEVWRVLDKHGSVRVRPPGETQWAQATVGTELAPGSRVVTDVDGWAVIQHADGNFWVEPNARLVLPSPETARVRQEAGTLHYRVIRAMQRHFEVETPYASLVVKGTVFDVKVAKTAMAVEVARGWVAVEARAGGRADLRAGQAARIGAAAGSPLEVRPAPGQAFAPVPPDVQITPAGQSLEPDPAERAPVDDEPDAQRSWFERVLGTLTGGDGGGGERGSGGDGGSDSSGTSGDGSSSGSSGSSGSGTGGSSSASSGTSGSGTGSSSSASSGTSGSGTSGSSSASSGTSGGSSSSASSGGGGLSVGVGLGGISAGVSVGGGNGAHVGAGIGGVGLGGGRHK